MAMTMLVSELGTVVRVLLGAAGVVGTAAPVEHLFVSKVSGEDERVEGRECRGRIIRTRGGGLSNGDRGASDWGNWGCGRNSYGGGRGIDNRDRNGWDSNRSGGCLRENGNSRGDSSGWADGSSLGDL